MALTALRSSPTGSTSPRPEWPEPQLAQKGLPDDCLHLYSSALCPFSQRVRLVLAAKGLAAREIDIDPRHKPPEFLALSPDGKIPLLVHGDVRLSDSAVIAEFLDDTFPAPALLPKNAARRASARYWVKLADETVYGPTHELLLTFDPALQRRRAAALAENVATLVSQAFAKGRFIGGPQPGLADLALLPWVEQLAVLERFRQFRLTAGAARLLAWRDAMAKQPAVKAVLRPPAFYLDGYTALLATPDR